ncbi:MULTISPECIES: energy-coupling factor ABC transporter ATP-binding protein [Peribacillus]|uniref:energy-coupling factor ABC transporter ATP-binding protein n=1 Tax=Peribacillus TaxID=2675229 RepID=UPI001F4DA295|nr:MULTISPECIES: ATP-binding cassette domain-containing protein [unclassified Peribacillus]MCK1983379.1 ATP-binding cassette domain-containing protein [Peribacillus sp. Aquil_B1]MCK2006397.1 ATP-binding cassette domain-containing protein [Peribacillus sp. Aquil_B8]
MDEHIFHIDGLTHQFADGTFALNELSLTIQHGKKIALLGNNGAGKSTLFLHLNGLLQPTAGKIRFKGKKMKYDRKSLLSLRKQVGIVFQDPDSQLFSANVQQDISFGPMNLEWDRMKVHEKVNWAMAQTEVTELKDRPTHFLSLGQKKRVAIAGILAMEPDVWLLDEPTAGLDPYFSRQIMALLDSIHDTEKTIILSTHDVNLAYQWADEVVVMNDGKVIYQGDPISVFHDEDVLLQAHLEKPWVFEMFQALLQSRSAAERDFFPRTKEELLQKLETERIY